MIFIRLMFTVQSGTTVVDNDCHYELKEESVSAHCQVTGRSPGFGNTVSHSHRRTKRTRKPNIQMRTYRLPSENRKIRLRVSAKGIKVIDRDGIEAVVARLRRDGVKI
jgi:large subunit ribosomal protein L28